MKERGERGRRRIGRERNREQERKEKKTRECDWK